MNEEPQRLRPPHYLLLSRDEAEDFGDNTVEVSVIDAFDEFTPGDWDDDAVWDNWSGDWVVAPDWVWLLDMTAEGFARYDLRRPDRA